MKIVQINEGLYCITPEEGNHLTQAAMQEGEPRVFCCSAYETIESNSAKWIEFTEDEKLAYEEQLAQQQEEEDINNDYISAMHMHR